jgi:hypothetical protein
MAYTTVYSELSELLDGRAFPRTSGLRVTMFGWPRNLATLRRSQHGKSFVFKT